MAPCTLVSCCDHIQVAYSRLETTNAEMKRKLEMVRFSLTDPVEIYARKAEGKFMEQEANKKSLTDALVDKYAPMNKVHD